MNKKKNSTKNSQMKVSAKDLAATLKPLVKQALVSAGKNLGSMAGAQVGMGTLGGKLGGKVAKRISKAIGSGDYTVSEPVAVNTLFSPKGSKSAKISVSDNETRIVHREYLGDVYNANASNSFANTTYPINPGLVLTFPYLSSIAQNFERYRVNGMVFEYVSTTSPYLAGGAMGTVMMAMEYNAAAPSFTSKPQFENSDFAISGRPDESMMYGVECEQFANNSYYTRSSASQTPVNLTDIGNFQIATLSPITANQVLGELWVSYDVVLEVPRISPARYGYAHLSGVASIGPLQGILTNSTITLAYGSMTGVYYDDTSSRIYFPNAEVGDTYQITIQTNATAAITSNLPLINAINTLAMNNTNVYHSSAGLGTAVNVYGATLLQYISLRTVTITTNAPGIIPYIQLNGVTSTVSSYTDVFVTDLGNGYGLNSL